MSSTAESSGCDAGTVAIGLGLGIPLFIAIIMVLCLWRRVCRRGDQVEMVGK